MRALPEPETPDGRHRRWLERSTGLGGLFASAVPRTLMWTMLNPSKASVDLNDPTAVRIVRFSRDNGFARLLAGNLFTFRATDPSDLDAGDPAANLPDADEILLALAAQSDAIALAWGSASGARNPQAVWRRAREVRELLARTGKPLLCLGFTSGKPSQPRHPLFVPAATPLRPIPEIVK